MLPWLTNSERKTVIIMWEKNVPRSNQPREPCSKLNFIVFLLLFCLYLLQGFYESLTVNFQEEKRDGRS